MTHTALPWDWFSKMGPDNALIKEPGFRMRFLVGADGQGLAHTVGLNSETDLANAELICKAVNNHADLVDALERAIHALSRIKPDMPLLVELQAVYDKAVTA
jgi:hypothetical protein